MSKGIQKYSVTLKGHRTSISLEPLFWETLHQMAESQNKPLHTLISEIEETHLISGIPGNLSSTLRLYILKELLKYKSI